MKIKAENHHKKKTTWTDLVAGWQSQVDRARAEAQAAQDAAAEQDAKAAAKPLPARRGRGFLDGHRRPGSYPRFTPRLGQTSRFDTVVPPVYVHAAVMPAMPSTALAKPRRIADATIAKQGTTDRTQSLYKCFKLPLVINAFREYLSNTTKKRVSSPNPLNSVLHFASVATLVVAQIVLLGMYFAALAPRARATRTFFQEIHRPVYQEDTEKREALIARWQTQVRTYSARYALGLTTYVAMMAGFAAVTTAWFLTRRAQDPWWGWLNWLQAFRDARGYVTGADSEEASASAVKGSGNGGSDSNRVRTPLSAVPFRPYDQG